MSGTTSSDPLEISLGHFKDWSNYLLVATVAAVGWIAKDTDGDPILEKLALWSFSISLVFGILSLALVPLIAEQRQPTHDSIYDVRVRFNLLWNFHLYLPQACRPQHILFIVGAVLYCLAFTVERKPRDDADLTRGGWCLVILTVASFWLPRIVREWGCKCTPAPSGSGATGNTAGSEPKPPTTVDDSPASEVEPPTLKPDPPKPES